jgi:hypothetical protein
MAWLMYAPLTFNHGVAGSSPAALTNDFNNLAENPVRAVPRVCKSIGVEQSRGRQYERGWSYEKTSSGAPRLNRTGHRWSVHWFSGRSEESRQRDRQSGRSGIWPHHPDGLGIWADRIGARKLIGPRDKAARHEARRACHSPRAISVIHRGAQRHKLE